MSKRLIDRLVVLSPMYHLRGLDWGHTEYYHSLLLRHVPAGAQRAIDVGCGTGMFARALAARVSHVDAIDVSDDALELARQRSNGEVSYRKADLLTGDFEDGSYDFVSCLMCLHHMPFDEGVDRLRRLLRRGGVLAILGLAAPEWRDVPRGAVTVAADLAMGIRFRIAKARGRPTLAGTGPEAPVAEPDMTWREVRDAFYELLPSGTYKQHVFYRYSFIYRKD